jgi:hypothetical protein
MNCKVVGGISIVGAIVKLHITHKTRKAKVGDISQQNNNNYVLAGEEISDIQDTMKPYTRRVLSISPS